MPKPLRAGTRVFDRIRNGFLSDTQQIIFDFGQQLLAPVVRFNFNLISCSWTSWRAASQLPWTVHSIPSRHATQPPSAGFL
jgi:hypothetical protein